MIKETDPIFKVKDFDDLKRFNQEERDDLEIARLKKQGTPVSRVLLAHKFGEGDCPCNQCSQG